MEAGNNIEALQILRVTFPFFSEDTLEASAGTKYYFPEFPQIDKRTIVGIECHAGGGAGKEDLYRPGVKLTGSTVQELQNILFVFKNHKGDTIFENVPAISLFGKFTFTGSPKQKIMPFLGRIKTKNCYAYIPANTGITFKEIYLTLTFYIR